MHATWAGPKCAVLSALVALIPGAFSDWSLAEAYTEHSTARRILKTALCRSLYNTFWSWLCPRAGPGTFLPIGARPCRATFGIQAPLQVCESVSADPRTHALVVHFGMPATPNSAATVLQVHCPTVAVPSWRIPVGIKADRPLLVAVPSTRARREAIIPFLLACLYQSIPLALTACCTSFPRKKGLLAKLRRCLHCDP